MARKPKQKKEYAELKKRLLGIVAHIRQLFRDTSHDVAKAVVYSGYTENAPLSKRKRLKTNIDKITSKLVSNITTQ